MSSTTTGGVTYRYNTNVRKLKAEGHTTVRSRTPYKVAHALIEEAKRVNASVEQTAGEILRYWYEDVYLPTQRAKR